MSTDPPGGAVSLLDQPTTLRADAWWRVPRSVGLLAVVAVLLRVPTLTAPPIPDEGGFLDLAQRWSRAGGSLYGRLWVDRPPLLVALFRLGGADGLLGVRLLGCVAAAVTVLAVGLVVSLTVGRGAAWASGLAAVLLAAPPLGGTAVDGELLALPFVASGLLCCVLAVRPGARPRAAVAAGVCAGAAVMVKQNFLDVGVFATALALTLVVGGRLAWPRLLRLTAAFTVGTAGCVGVVLGGAWLVGGTPPGGVLFAMYPFRVEAAGPLLQHAGDERASHLQQVIEAWLLSGGPVLVLLLVGVAVGALRADAAPELPVVMATLVLAAYDVVSVLLGGGFWPHYLVQLVPVSSLAAGLVVARVPRTGRAVAAAAVGLTVVMGCWGLTQRSYLPGPAVGRSLGAVSRPGDSVVSAFGNPDIAQQAGLVPGYRYPWSLPAATLDPDMTLLRRTLAGSSAPTWLVVRPDAGASMRRHGLGPVIDSRYRLVAVLCGRRVLLRDDVDRATPRAPAHCRLPVSPWVYDLLHPSFDTGTASRVSDDRPRSVRLP